MKERIWILIAILIAFINLLPAQDTLNMSLVGKFNYPYLEGAAVVGNYAYTLNNSSSPPDVFVIDISDPSNPDGAGSKSLQDDLYYPNHIFVSGSHLFIGALGPYFSILDITDPVYPKIVNGYDEYCFDARFRGPYMFLAAGTNGLVILDISDLQHIKELDSYEPSSNVLGVDIADTLAFLACENGEIDIVNIKNTSFTSLVKTFTTPGKANRIVVSGDYAFVADGEQGLRIYDISQLNSIREVGSFVSDSLAKNVNFVQMRILGSHALLLDANFGIRMLDISDVTNPKQVAYFKLHLGKDFYASGDMVYATDENSFMVIHNKLLTGMQNTSTIPNDYYLAPNFPNPFNGETVIRFRTARKERVTIKIYDILGREKGTILDAVEPAGTHQVKFRADAFSSGVYFYRLQTPHFTAVRKMVLMK